MRCGFEVSGHDMSQSAFYQIGTQGHQSVVHGAYIILIGDVYGALVDDIAGVYFVLKEESGYACACIAVDDGPVDGRGAAIVRQ